MEGVTNFGRAKILSLGLGFPCLCVTVLNLITALECYPKKNLQ